MLTLTNNASQMIGELVERRELPAGSGIRIGGAPTDPATLTVAMADAPEADDTVIQQGGARVFVEANTVDMLDDKMLDAEISEDGRLHFTLSTQ